jgi:hypothetical protein
VYNCVQQTISWFGIEVIPIFLQKLVRSKQYNTAKGDDSNKDDDEDEDEKEEEGILMIQTSILDSKTELDTKGKQQQEEGQHKRKRMSSRIQSLMDKSTFRGGSIYSVQPQSDGKSWIITSELSLQLTIPLGSSRFIALPPGFNTIGSRIVRNVCDRRARESLDYIQESYVTWCDNAETEEETVSTR